MSYIDGFVIPMPKKNLAAYKKMAAAACKVWMDHGAVRYVESVGDDMKPQFGVPFPKLSGAKSTETVVFSYIEYKSKAHRNAVNKKVMKDPRLAALCDPKNTPFDMTKLAYGGFKGLVESKR